MDGTIAASANQSRQPLAVTVRFIPHAPAFNSVIAQIKSGSVAYSVFALARLFLEKPERYDVQLTTAEDRPLFQLGENGAVASDRQILETSAFASARETIFTRSRSPRASRSKVISPTWRAAG